MRLSFSSALAAVMLVFVPLAFGQSLFQLEQRLQGAAVPPAAGSPAGGGTADAAAPQNGYLGAELDDEGQQDKGVLVTKIKPDTPAEKSGLKANDLITTINGKQIKNLDDYDLVAKGSPGTKIQMTVVRDGRPQLLTVTLGARPGMAEPAPAGGPALTSPATSPPPPGPAGTSPSLGPATGLTPVAPPISSAPGRFEATPRSSIPAETPLPLGPPPSDTITPPSSAPGSFPAPSATTGGGASLGISVETVGNQPRVDTVGPVRRGAFITQVRPGSPAAQAALPVGAVIVQIDTRRVNSSDDLVAAIRAARPGQEVELAYYDGERLVRKSVRLAAAGAPAASGAPTVGEAPGSNPAPGGIGSSAGGLANAPGPAGGGLGGGAAPTPPGQVTDPQQLRLPGLGGATGRPLLNRVERMVDNFARQPPAATGAAPSPDGVTPPHAMYDPYAMQALQKSVSDLAAVVQGLEQRIKALEGRGGAATPSSAPSFGTAPGPAGTRTNP